MLLHERVLAPDIRLDILGMLLRDPHLEFPVRPGGIRVGPHVVAEGEMARDVSRPHCERMHVVGPLSRVVVLAEEPSTGDAELAHRFIPERLHAGSAFIERVEVGDFQE